MAPVLLKGGLAAVAAGLLAIVAGIAAAELTSKPAPARPARVAAHQPSPAPATPAAARPAQRPGLNTLQNTVAQLLNTAGATGGVTLTELGGPSPTTWSYDGDDSFTAASTYKLPLLMEDAQNVAAGRAKGTDSLCYQDADWEDGYYSDYQAGMCLSRAQLEQRVGQMSDNTAAHILVRVDGGTDALNSYANAHGSRNSKFYYPNTTTTNDLARLWVDEARGRAGGKTAQQYLYPMLTHTAYEDGIPAGVGKQATVVHKIGILGGVVNDAALVRAGPKGDYVLAICTNGAGGDAGWKLVADISRAVWSYESTR